MTHKALITKRGVPRAEAVAAEIYEAKGVGCIVEHQLPNGTLVRGEKQQFAKLKGKGYRVKLLLNTNILKVGSYRIDIESPPKVPKNLEVPKSLEKEWQHHLVQLAGPSTPDWISAIEDQGVDVVESISSYGLFVVGSPEEVNNLKNLSFVAWVGPFKPAYRISPNLQGLKGKIQYVNIGIYPETEVTEVKRAVQNAKGTIIEERSAKTGQRDRFSVLVVELRARNLAKIARLVGVRWLEYQPRIVAFDERSTQIVAEDLNPANTQPVTGYQGVLTDLGLDGTGVVVGICDTGVDTNNSATMHLDLRGRMAFFTDRTIDTATNISQTPQDGWWDPTYPLGQQRRGGHGTHVAGIAVGNAAMGNTDPDGFLLGQGVAPGADFGVVNPIETLSPPGARGGPQDWAQDMVNGGADIMNNSWGRPATGTYSPDARIMDMLVRDPNSDGATLDYLVLVGAVGNRGGMPGSIADPQDAKNPIVVGSSLNFRPGELFTSDDIRGIYGTSSRGPAESTLQGDRCGPTVVAPGVNIISARTTINVANPATGVAQRPIPAYQDLGGALHNDHTPMTGTSMAAPHVSGLCALLIEWWRNRTDGRNPSPAMLKALLVNGAEDIVGGENWRRVSGWVLDSGNIYRLDNLGFVPDAVVDITNPDRTLAQVASLPNLTAPGQWFYDNVNDALYVRTQASNNPWGRIHVLDPQRLSNIPNNDQGWGRASLENIVLQAGPTPPTSDRGPKIFMDQRHAFTANDQEHTIRVAAHDTTRAMRITLVWTDARGAVNASPALVNDLDLEVKEEATGNIYKGNVFTNGFSTPGGDFDTVNNIECVYIENPNGVYEVKVIAGEIRENARPPYGLQSLWQDFALVLDNVRWADATPVSVVPVIDRSGSMDYYGYVDVTKISSKQFVDLMDIDDKLAIVSFGNTGDIEYPTGGSPTLQSITYQSIQDAAKAAIEGITFGGCTYLAEGIQRAQEMLNLAPGARAMVLLSDGYDNKGCRPSDPARPSAMDAVRSLPRRMPIYTCAMGSVSDQTLLEQIATETGGRYYYMPTIDDLFEIYNYIRGLVTGDAIIVNESISASSNSVGAFVDALSTEATFTVTWADPNIKYVPGEPKNANEVNVRLRNQRGQLLHSNTSYIRRIEGDGYVAFKLQEPMPGQWSVEVKTAGDNHMNCTVGGFVQSPLRLVVSVIPKQIIAGVPLTIAAQVFEGRWPIKGLTADAQLIKPSLSIQKMLRKYRTQLKEIREPLKIRGDRLPSGIIKLSALRNKMLKKAFDIFAPISTVTRLKDVTIGNLARMGLGYLIPPDVAPIGIEEAATVTSVFQGASMYLAPSQPIRDIRSAMWMLPTAVSGVLMGKFKNTKQQGSYNIVVTANGISPISKTRFVRKELVSVLVK